MDVDDGGAGLGRFNGSVGNLFGRDRHVRMFADGIGGAGDGTGDNDVSVHDHPL